MPKLCRSCLLRNHYARGSELHLHWIGLADVILHSMWNWWNLDLLELAFALDVRYPLEPADALHVELNLSIGYGVDFPLFSAYIMTPALGLAVATSL